MKKALPALVVCCIQLICCVGDEPGSDTGGGQDAATDATSDAAISDGAPSDASSCTGCPDSECFEGVCGGKLIIDLSEGDHASCVVYASRSVWCWGQGDDGELGVDPSTLTTCGDEDGLSHKCRPAPGRVPGVANAKRVSVGSGFACALLMDGTVACWGSNTVGQLGHTPGQQGDVKCASDDCQWSAPAVVSGIAGVRDFMSGQEGACAVVANGDVWCWGGNTYLELGHTGSNGAPAKVAGVSNASRVATSLNAPHVCAVVIGGDLMCWGMNYQSELGHSGGTDVTCTASSFACNSVPAALGLSGVEAVSAPQANTCVRSGTAVQCWGSNNRGQLGNGATGGTSATPASVSIGPADTLGGGKYAMCVLETDHSITCWGSNAFAGLGASSTDPDAGTAGCQAPTPCYASPQTIPSFTATKLSCGTNACLALAEDGTAWGWGINTMGQTGHPATTGGDKTCGTFACSPAPSAVQGLP